VADAFQAFLAHTSEESGAQLRRHEPLNEGETAIAETSAAETANPLAGPARIPGQPSEGRKRRTRAEMAEDDAYFAAHPEAAASSGAVITTSAISTGGERVDPAAAAQDEADEAAESAAAKTGDLTTEDLRDIIGQYSQKHGIAAAQADVPKLLGGKGIHEIEKTQESLGAAIKAVRDAMDGKQAFDPPGENLFGDDKPAVVEEVHATKDDVMDAIKSYAKKFDGQNSDLAKAVMVNADIPLILDRALGVKQLSKIPADPVSYGKALKAINDAVTGNPFNREVVK
jgi:hypothetical protein